MTNMIVEPSESIAVIKLNREITNALNLELVLELTEVLGNLSRGNEVLGIVLTSNNNKFFSIGFDIKELYALPRIDFVEFYRAFNRLCIELSTLLKPVTAAISGHATAGGYILSLCCDYRFIASGRKLTGLNEIKLGVPLPYPADCLLRNLVGFRNARDILDSGDFFEPQQALERGMVDRIVEHDELIPQSIEHTRMLGSYSAEAFSKNKTNRVEHIQDQINARLKEKEELFVDFWYSPEARERLKVAIAKF